MGIIRFLLAVAVVVGHVGPAFNLRLIPGDLAVQCFFIISGFYMSLILGTRYSLDRAGLRAFYLNRILRLMPTYWVVLVCCIGLAVVTHTTYNGFSVENFVRIYRALPAPHALWLIFTNIFLVGIDATMFQIIARPGVVQWAADFNSGILPAHKLLLITPAWSLGIELWFYMLVPFLVPRSWRVVAAIAIVSLGIRLALFWNGLSEDPWQSRFFPSELMWFLLGMLMHRLYSNYRHHMGQKLPYGIFALVCVGLFAFPFIHSGEGQWRWLFLLTFSAAVPFIFHLTKSNNWDRSIGELSYPLYISHTFCHQATVMSGLVRPEYYSSAILVVALLFSLLLRIVVEIPVDRFRGRLISR